MQTDLNETTFTRANQFVREAREALQSRDADRMLAAHNALDTLPQFGNGRDNQVDRLMVRLRSRVFA